MTKVDAERLKPRMMRYMLRLHTKGTYDDFKMPYMQSWNIISTIITFEVIGALQGNEQMERLATMDRDSVVRYAYETRTCLFS
jgi:hypothetical protein